MEHFECKLESLIRNMPLKMRNRKLRKGLLHDATMAIFLINDSICHMSQIIVTYPLVNKHSH
jgi:hypothetical protein